MQRNSPAAQPSAVQPLNSDLLALFPVSGSKYRYDD
ncbi:hypothetical protein FOQG_06577 [Fusarium oxysporum f. sp. raphani 54005]|uniref:Uncharacterized protein n=2 Tax=Fusarium oxysporum TaxID=5507 RepID=X0D8Y4_FUSOX|nr:hypothetical protein FOVG_06289 [Fusarium oxysporum f. sp. pisi HDV247]EXK91067.1 hypothetical protein FOQG_06577 [Fusarium oxysporum f. sp. raphani 54005]